MIPAQYQVKLKDQSGAVVAIFDAWEQLEFTHTVNDIGVLTLAFSGDDERTSLFELDGQVEVLRNITGNPSGWHTEWEGFVRYFNFETHVDGYTKFTVIGRSYLYLLSGRWIVYAAGSGYVQKSGVGETVIKAYVDENAGPSATTPPRLLKSGVVQGLSIEADAANGSTWAGARAYKNLLTTIQDIASVSGVDFNVVGTGPATFEFRVYDEQRGSDRTTTGLVANTGLNGAGNSPVIFALQYGNMDSPHYTENRINENTNIIILGSGVEDDREVVLQTNATTETDSPWNDREAVRQGSNGTTAELQAVGDKELVARQAKETFDFDIIQLPRLRYGATAYGGQYHWGDTVTARYKTNIANKKITRVRISVSDNGQEEISLEFGD